ncbi:MAG: hypothetical protein Q4D58_03960 [Synergistaceae bacterium]|nr:hypothetical protein [Synergistaceae bacterium]
MLSFKHYIKGYVRFLSHGDSMRISLLAQEAAGRNPRLREPLFCYAFVYDRMELLLKHTKPVNEKLYAEYQRLYETAEGDHEAFMRMAEGQPAAIPYEYTKVYVSYRAAVNKKTRDTELKSKLRAYVCSFLEKHPEVTCHRIAKELDLVPGNVSTYLHKGDLSKVSVATARRIFDFVLAWEREH